MNNALLYIYNPEQAIFMIGLLQGKHIYRIGKGGQGDILITFEKNNNTLQALKQWQLNNK